ncbi:MAG: isoaspartyl peptidase/L-asparaginase [Chlorobi bacterium]|nr:isoaspartyl peptidase/L-asparaginase [Chlorobiota bacterium]
MKRWIWWAFTVWIWGACRTPVPQAFSETSAPLFGVVIHGGAGTIRDLPPRVEEAYRKALNRARDSAYEVLARGGSAVDAVETAIRLMEDDPLFNAGRGSVRDAYGEVRMDASIMDGRTLNAGAVANVRFIRHPISAARLVMDSCRHVCLTCEGAEQFARERGLEMMSPDYFDTGALEMPEGFTKYGTVGCVALDKDGNLAAGTSTGGLSGKKYGRVGDSPVIGAGTYADNRTCAVSATGTGEYFIRTAAAHRVSALMAYAGKSLDEALRASIDSVGTLGGDGGFIGIDRRGRVSWYFNTAGMFRAYRLSDGRQKTAMYGLEQD